MNYNRIIKNTRTNLFNYSSQNQEKAKRVIKLAKELNGIKKDATLIEIKDNCPFIENKYLLPIKNQ